MKWNLVNWYTEKVTKKLSKYYFCFVKKALFNQFFLGNLSMSQIFSQVTFQSVNKAFLPVQ